MIRIIILLIPLGKIFGPLKVRILDSTQQEVKYVEKRDDSD